MSLLVSSSNNIPNFVNFPQGYPARIFRGFDFRFSRLFSNYSFVPTSFKPERTGYFKAVNLGFTIRQPTVNLKGSLRMFGSSGQIKESNIQVMNLSSSDIGEIHKIGLSSFDSQQAAFPEIWKKAEDVNSKYRSFLENYLSKKNAVGLAATLNGKFSGFVLGKYVMPPAVYDAGLTCMIDEFHLSGEACWHSIGQQLFDQLRKDARKANATQFLMINQSAHDAGFDRFLGRNGLNSTSQWWAGSIPLSDQSQAVKTRLITKNDIKDVVELSHIKRKSYELAQPLFWKMAQFANEEQYQFLCDQITWPGVIGLVAEEKGQIVGFVIGHVSKSPDFYKDAFLCNVDDFMVITPENWNSVGGVLLSRLQREALKINSSCRMWIVSGSHDKRKLQLLHDLSLKRASEWHTGAVK